MDNNTKTDGRKNNGGHKNGGRKSRAELGLAPLKNYTVSMPTDERAEVIAKYGTLIAAIRASMK